jgi:hypothetical protein
MIVTTELSKIIGLVSYPAVLALWSESISITIIVVGELEAVVGRQIFKKDIPQYIHTFPPLIQHISLLPVRLSLNLAKEYPR